MLGNVKFYFVVSTSLKPAKPLRTNAAIVNDRVVRRHAVVIQEAVSFAARFRERKRVARRAAVVVS
jgi:hypothetical protein